MKLVYDLRFARDHYVGIASYACSVLAALLARDETLEIAALWNPGCRSHFGDLEALRRHPRVRWVETTLQPSSIIAAWPLGRLVRSLAVDAYVSPFYLVPRGAGVPTVVTVHDVRPLRMAEGFSWRSRMLFRGAMFDARRADAVIAISEFTRAEMCAVTHVDSRRLRVVPSGVTAPPSEPPAPPAGAPHEPFALFVGGNRPHKNLAHLARVWATWGDEPPLALVCAGPEDARFPGLAALADSAGARRVHALGRVSDAEREWLLRHAACFVFPTLYEGFGLPVGEAFSRGLPVIASDIPVIREVAHDAGWLLPPHDVDAWSRAVARLAADASERARWQAAGLARARNLTFAQTAEGVLGVVRRVLARSESR